jgi:hypothetical protein
MLRSRFTVLVLAVLVTMLSTSFAGTYIAYAVGSPSCNISLVGYQTIQAAVNAVPSGSTIKVCPGTYPEQVSITKPLTLTGFTGSNAEALVTVPAGGVTQSVFTSFIGTTYYQILVQTTGPVNITDLAVDGTGNGIPPGVGDLAGIFYEDSTGTVNGVSVRNEVDDTGGFGIQVATTTATAQTVTIENSDIRGFDGYGIWGVTSNSLTLKVNNNTITNTGNTGIVYEGPVHGTVQTNLINGSGNGYGIELTQSGATVTGNTVISSTVDGPPNIGIAVNGGSNIIKSNRLDAGPIGAGIILLGSTSGAGSFVQANTITGGSGGYGIDMCGQGAASGFTVTGNTIIDTPGFGLRRPASGNTTTPNTYFADGATPTVVGC